MSSQLVKALSPISAALILAFISPTALASDFNIPFMNIAGLGTAYADWATAANDASTAYANPAGLVNIQHQQLVLSAMGLTGHTEFTGTTTTPPFPFPLTVRQSGAAASHLGAFLPSFYYALPITPRYVFGFGVTAPFALGTNYATDSIVRYAATRSQVIALDAGPSLGIKVNEQLSVGLGLDVMRLSFTLNNMYGPPISIPDAEVQNHLSGVGYGYHAGILYQIIPPTRIGVSFNSMVTIHTTGNSTVFSPFPPGRSKINNNKTNSSLPARLQLSLQHDITPDWTVMGTVFYTNWSTFDKITMKRVLVPGGGGVVVSIPFNYHNTLDYSIGTSVRVNEQWLLRAGYQWMNTPSNDRNRGVSDPIGSANVIGVGAHYQQNLCLGYDIGYGHSFFKQEAVNFSNAVTSASGHNNSQSNVYGAQITWNIA